MSNITDLNFNEALNKVNKQNIVPTNVNVNSSNTVVTIRTGSLISVYDQKKVGGKYVKQATDILVGCSAEEFILIFEALKTQPIVNTEYASKEEYKGYLENKFNKYRVGFEDTAPVKKMDSIKARLQALMDKKTKGMGPISLSAGAIVQAFQSELKQLVKQGLFTVIPRAQTFHYARAGYMVMTLDEFKIYSVYRNTCCLDLVRAYKILGYTLESKDKEADKGKALRGPIDEYTRGLLRDYKILESAETVEIVAIKGQIRWEAGFLVTPRRVPQLQSFRQNTTKKNEFIEITLQLAKIICLCWMDESQSNEFITKLSKGIWNFTSTEYQELFKMEKGIQRLCRYFRRGLGGFTDRSNPIRNNSNMGAEESEALKKVLSQKF